MGSGTSVLLTFFKHLWEETMAGEGVTLFSRVATPRLATLQKLKPLRAYCLQLINPHSRHINFPLVNSRSRYAKQCRQLQHATR